MAGPPTCKQAITGRQALRSELRKRRELFVSGRGAEFTIAPELQALMSNAKCVASYLKMGSEVDAAGAIASAKDRWRAIALPRIASRGQAMVFHAWEPGDPLELAAYGFEQPLADTPPTTPDLVLTPLLGFDRAGNRLGQGGGHYDRYFSMNDKALRIGLAWSAQEVPVLASEDWDIPLDAVCTELEWIVTSCSRLTR